LGQFLKNLLENIKEKEKMMFNPSQIRQKQTQTTEQLTPFAMKAKPCTSVFSKLPTLISMRTRKRVIAVSLPLDRKTF
jgi:hypothetical protein